jgi:hypothetical protein
MLLDRTAYFIYLNDDGYEFIITLSRKEKRIEIGYRNGKIPIHLENNQFEFDNSFSDQSEKL